VVETDRMVVEVTMQFRTSLKAEIVSININDVRDYNDHHSSTGAVVSATVAAIVAATSHRVFVALRIL